MKRGRGQVRSEEGKKSGEVRNKGRGWEGINLGGGASGEKQENSR